MSNFNTKEPEIRNVTRKELQATFVKNKGCRICDSTRLYAFLELGPQPPANSFLSKDQLLTEERFYPLTIYFCEDCGLVQLRDIISPEVLFKHYVYLTGMSQTMKEHFYSVAAEIVEDFNLGKNDLVIDIGSNDGSLLNGFKQLGTQTLGIEPATNVALIAEANGIETINDFFSFDVSNNIIEKKGHAKVIIGTNVFGHVNDLHEFLKVVDSLLAHDGIFIVEVPYLIDLLSNTEFDTIYHEHLSYFSVRPLVTLFKRFNMELFNVKRVKVHGGTIRCYIRKEATEINESVHSLLRLEEDLKLGLRKTYSEFGDKTKQIRIKLNDLLSELKNKGCRIVGYGASAKGNVLLNYCKIGTDILDYVLDNTPLKQGLFTPGTHIPVQPPSRLLQDTPDYVLVLAWNHLNEILMKEQEYRKFGRKFIVPIPEPRII